MSNNEIDAVRELLRSKPRPAGLAERRERLDAIGSTYPPDADVSLEATDANGVAAEWSLAPGSDPSKVLLFFHGGGYCSGSIMSHRGMVTAVGRAAGVRTLAVAYRLAPEHPFPAAIEDARAAYGFLLDRGIAAPNIALGGDSAGGGLTLALMTSLRDAGKPLPGCAWLVSPWVDLQMTGASLAAKADVDPLISKSYLEELASAYLAGADAANPLVSPLNADLAGLPPLLVQVGSAERLLDDAVWIARRAGAADVRINLEIWPHMIHAWHLWAAQLEEGRRAIASAGAFIRARSWARSVRPCVFQNSRDLRIAARAGMLQRRDAVPVGKGAAPISEHHGLEQSGAAEIVDVVERRLRRDQGAHDLRVPAVRGGDQCSVVMGTGDGACVAAALERDPEHFEVVVHGRDGDDVVALGIERVRVGAEPEEGARCRILAQKGGDVQRRAAVGVLDVGLFALGDQLLDLGGVAARGGIVKTGIDAQLPLARRGLRKAYGAGELGCANRHESN